MSFVNRNLDEKSLQQPMTGTLRFRNASLFSVLMIGLVLFLALGIMFSISKQRTLLLRQEDVHMRHELALLEKVIQEELGKEDLGSAVRLLNLFVSERTNIVSIRALTSDGRVLAGGQRSDPSASVEVFTQRISYGDGRHVDVEVFEDRGPLLQKIDSITKQYLSYSLIFVFMMGAGLWYAFRKTLLRPMELTVEETSRINVLLEQSVKERTMEWMRANSDLQMEIQERLAAEKQIRESEKELRRNYELQSVFNELLSISLEGLSLGDILQKALDLIVSVSWLSLEAKGSIHLVEDEPDMLIMTASKGLSVHLLGECSRLPFGKCMCGKAALTQSVQYADCIDERHDISYAGIEPHGHYCVPFFSAGKVSGVMNLYINKGHPRDERECSFLKSYANVLAGIIQSKRAEEERSILITELQDAFEKVTRSQGEWRATFDSISDLIYITDVSHTIIKANKAFAAYFGMTPRQVIGRKCYDLFKMPELICSTCPHANSLREQRMAQGEFVDQGRGITFLMTASPYYSQNGELVGTIISCKDVTEEREKEMRLIMNERLASLGQMASGIAHEINNPLAAVAGCTEGLLKRMEQERFEPELFKNYLKIIEEEVLRCKNITSGMLSFVRKTTYDTQDVDIHQILDKAIEIVGFQGRLKEVEIVRDYKAGPPYIQGSEGELRQVFLAIIMNAIDVMEDRGQVTLETGMEEGEIFVRITDTGPGIPQEHMTRVFEPFFTTKAEKGGTGLGLAIASKIIANHRGTVTVSSERGRWTTFTITLPV
jgi:PAS domain S-box-containing protein